MKILNINSNYFNAGLYKLMDKEFIKQGLEVVTYVPLHAKSNIREECRFELPKNVDKVICLKKYDRLIFHLKHHKIIKDITLRYNFNEFEKIYAHSLFSNGYIALNLYKKFKIPYIVMVYGTDINVFFKYMFHLRGIGIEIMRFAEHIIFSSEGCREELCNTYLSKELKEEVLRKSKVIPFGIDRIWFDNKRNKKKEMGNKIRLITVASIEKNKNQSTVVEACKILKCKGYDVEYTIVGKTIDDSILKKVSSEKFVTYIERQEQKEIIEIYNKQDIFIMPSIKESFGLVYPEAMSQGLPIIYTKGQGFDKYFRDGEVGYPVQPFSAEDITNKILDIVNEYEKISLTCIEKVEQFKWENIIQEYLGLFGVVR